MHRLDGLEVRVERVDVVVGHLGELDVGHRRIEVFAVLIHTAAQRALELFLGPVADAVLLVRRDVGCVQRAERRSHRQVSCELGTVPVGVTRGAVRHVREIFAATDEGALVGRRGGWIEDGCCGSDASDRQSHRSEDGTDQAGGRAHASLLGMSRMRRECATSVLSREYPKSPHAPLSPAADPRVRKSRVLPARAAGAARWKTRRPFGIACPSATTSRKAEAEPGADARGWPGSATSRPMHWT